MKAKYLVALALIVFIVPSIASAVDEVPGWTSLCVNASYLEKTANIEFNGTSYPFKQNVQCPYGCALGRDICWKWPGDALPSEYFMLFEVIAIAMLFVGLVRLDEHKETVRIFDVIVPLMALILFPALALQGNNIIDASTGEAVRLIFVVWFDYGMAAVSLVIFFFSLFKYMHSEVNK